MGRVLSYDFRAIAQNHVFSLSRFPTLPYPAQLVLVCGDGRPHALKLCHCAATLLQLCLHVCHGCGKVGNGERRLVAAAALSLPRALHFAAFRIAALPSHFVPFGLKCLV